MKKQMSRIQMLKHTKSNRKCVTKLNSLKKVFENKNVNCSFRHECNCIHFVSFSLFSFSFFASFCVWLVVGVWIFLWGCFCYFFFFWGGGGCLCSVWFCFCLFLPFFVFVYFIIDILSAHVFIRIWPHNLAGGKSQLYSWDKIS